MIHDVGSPEAAHELEMQILDSLRRGLNHCVPEREEMVKNVSFNQVREAYNEVVFSRKRAA